ncbi:hypothetical protein CRE_14719 [Caenorhabditis remanei]|uniref:Uncharacterized protein n=1 Tax=Caenorhabditis remanei TaxID=31234 RepID=E3M9Q9_CAERE|nr:hypothetical protein CRE_14719 [Caenorhabditis remanei]
MKAEFFGRVTCHVVWCVQLMYMEEDYEFEPYVLIQHDCLKDNTKYRYEHKYPAQSNKINCTSYKYDLNLFELG